MAFCVFTSVFVVFLHLGAAFAGGMDFIAPPCPTNSEPKAGLLPIPRMGERCTSDSPEVTFECERSVSPRGPRGYFSAWRCSSQGWYYLARTGQYDEQGLKVDAWNVYQEPPSPDLRGPIASSIEYVSGVPVERLDVDDTGQGRRTAAAKTTATPSLPTLNVTWAGPPE